MARSRELHQRPNTLTQTELSFSSSLAIPRRTIHSDISGYRSPQSGCHYRRFAISLRFADFTLIWNAEWIARVLATGERTFRKRRFSSTMSFLRRT